MNCNPTISAREQHERDAKTWACMSMTEQWLARVEYDRQMKSHRLAQIRTAKIPLAKPR